MILSGSHASGGFSRVDNDSKRRNPTAGVSSAGLSVRKKKNNPSMVSNIDKIKGKSSRTLPEEFHYKPKVSETFLENWLDFPVDRKVNLFVTYIKMWMTWLQWTNKGMAGLDPKDTSIRSRVCSQISVLGTAAGLFLVIAIAGFLVPPELRNEDDRIYLDVFGLIMFTASLSLIFYIGVALTAVYPLIESLRDDVAFDAFENYQNRIGGYDSYLFFLGMHLVIFALLVAAKILYSFEAMIIMFGLMGIFIVFLALDPISSMHMGLSNDPEEQYRAELMSHFILRKIPNNIMTDDLGEEIFMRKNESVKYEETKVRRASMQQEMELAAIAASRAVDGDDNVDGKVQLFSSKDIGNEKLTEKLSDGLKLTDIESNKVPFCANKKDTALPTQKNELSLKDAFCDPDKFLFKQVDLGLSESIAARDCLVKAGCTSWTELLEFLDDHKQKNACTCSNSTNHSEDCAVRQVGAWTDALTKLGIPAFHSRKIILVLKKHLR